MKAFRKVTAPSLERNKIRVRDMLAKMKADKLLEKKESEVDEEEGDGEEKGDRGTGKWDEQSAMDEVEDFGIGDSDSIIGDSASVCSYTTSVEKPRLNRAEKKKMKRQGMTNDQMSRLAVRRAHTKQMMADNTSTSIHSSGASMGLLEGLEMDGGAGSSFKDNKFFMSYGNEDEQQRMQEDLMQPQSGLRDLEMQSK